MQPTQVHDFRPIANIRLFYEVFACLVLERNEHQLDDHQPEEQHGFRRGKRIEEHLLAANPFLEKPWLLVFQCRLYPGSVKGIWPSPLASTLEKLAWTRHLKTQNTGFGWYRHYMTGNLERSSDRQVGAKNSPPRMCFEPLSLLHRVAVCHAEMDIESWWPWLWFAG